MEKPCAGPWKRPAMMICRAMACISSVDWLLGANTVPLGQLVKELGVSKQAVGQLVDTLVLRGYLERKENEEDRRKSNIVLTKRGRAAASIQAAAREKIDAELISRAGQENILRTRRTLALLIDIGRETAEEQDDEH